MILPIPGTGSIAHLEENVGACAIRLTDAERARIDERRPGQTPAEPAPQFERI